MGFVRQTTFADTDGSMIGTKSVWSFTPIFRDYPSMHPSCWRPALKRRRVVMYRRSGRYRRHRRTSVYSRTRSELQ